MSTIGSNLNKLNTSAQLQTFPYPMAPKSFPYSNAFMAKSGEQTLDVQMRDGQTKNLAFIAADRHQAWHGDRGPRARSFTSKTFGV